MLDRTTIERATAKAGDAPIVIALSGGGDSTALLRLLVEAYGASRLHALVVDHALREGSDREALRAKGFAESLGVAGEILTLCWPEGPKRAQQAARRARYAALCDATRKLGAKVIALAHTADDQAETVLMRAASGSGWRGLAGMARIAPAPVWPEGRGIVLARPLLDARRASLRAHLRARSADWIEDPANANPAFERVRVRQNLTEWEREGLNPHRLCDLAKRLRRVADSVDAAAWALIQNAANVDASRIIIDPSKWRGAAAVRQRALSVLLTAASGTERAPDAKALQRLEARMVDPVFAGASLGGAVLTFRKRSVVIRRDVGALLGRSGGAGPIPDLAIPTGVESVWDGRLAIATSEPDWIVRPSEDGMPIFARDGQTLSLKDAPALARWLVEDHVRHLVDRD